MRLPAFATLFITAASTLAGGYGHSHGHSHGDEGYHEHEKDVTLDCSATFCKMQLSDDLEKRWHIHLPSDDYDPSDDMCAILHCQMWQLRMLHKENEARIMNVASWCPEWHGGQNKPFARNHVYVGTNDQH